MDNLSEQLSILFGVLIGISVKILIFSLPVMYLWNWLVPVILGFNEITMFQSIGLILLIRLLISKD